MNPLVQVCALLNKHNARYVIIGGQACILHGLVRTTEDVDMEDNFRRVIAALSELPDHAAAELTPADFRDNVVVKVADQVEVDVSRSAWKITYVEATRSLQHATFDGVDIPFAGLEILIASKETYREQDRADIVRLKDLARKRNDSSGAT